MKDIVIRTMFPFLACFVVVLNYDMCIVHVLLYCLSFYNFRASNSNVHNCRNLSFCNHV